MSSNLEATSRYKEFDTEALASLSKIVADGMKRATKCCPNCINFLRREEQCGLNRLRPPADVIAFGCECFDEDGVPF
jgi:hypothetical protein